MIELIFSKSTKNYRKHKREKFESWESFMHNSITFFWW